MTAANATDLLNATQAAELLGISRQSMYTAVKAGHITTAERSARGPRFDPDVITREWERRRDYSRVQSNHIGEIKTGGRPAVRAEAAGGAGNTGAVEQAIADAKALKAQADAEMAQLDLRERRGELVSAEEIRARGAELGSVLMGAIAALPARVAQQLAVMSDAGEIHRLLEEELNGMIRAIRKACGIPEDGDE